MSGNLIRLAVAHALATYHAPSPVCLNMESDWYHKQDEFELGYMNRTVYKSELTDEISAVAA